MSTDTDRGHILLRCRKLRLGYGGLKLLPEFDLDVRVGELLLVVGRNGTGKTTWVKTVLGLLSPLGGSLEPSHPAPRVAYVPQDAVLDPILPIHARDVVGWGRLRAWSFLKPLPSPKDRRVRRKALAEVEAEAFAGMPFRELSGGQKQRVLFARMLASEADLVLLDEPTASLDMTSELEAYQRLAVLARERRAAVVVVTHTIAVASKFADRVLFFDRGGERGGEGFVTSGEPGEVFSHPVFERHFGAFAKEQSSA